MVSIEMGRTRAMKVKNELGSAFDAVLHSELSSRHTFFAAAALLTVPGIWRIPHVSVASIQVGLVVDDAFDLGIRKNELKAYIREKNAPVSTETAWLFLPPEYTAYFRNSPPGIVDALEKDGVSLERANVIRKNLRRMTDAIYLAEQSVYYHEQSYWNPDRIRTYRESVALHWGAFFASLSNNAIELPQIDHNPISTVPERGYGHVHEGYLDWFARQEYDGMRTAKLAYALIMINQVLGDTSDNGWNRSQGNPGFGTFGYKEQSARQVQAEEVKRYIDQCSSLGFRFTDVLKMYPYLLRAYSRLLKKEQWGSESQAVLDYRE